MKRIRIFLYMSICFYTIETTLYAMEHPTPTREPSIITSLRARKALTATSSAASKVQSPEPSAMPLRVQVLQLQQNIHDEDLKNRMITLYRSSSQPRRSSPDHYATFYE